jgi:hypothetical protein
MNLYIIYSTEKVFIFLTIYTPFTKDIYENLITAGNHVSNMSVWTLEEKWWSTKYGDNSLWNWGHDNIFIMMYRLEL